MRLELLVAQLVHGLQNLFHTLVVQNDALLLAELISGDHLRLDVSALANQDWQLRIALLDRLIELGDEVSGVRRARVIGEEESLEWRSDVRAICGNRNCDQTTLSFHCAKTRCKRIFAALSVAERT